MEVKRHTTCADLYLGVKSRLIILDMLPHNGSGAVMNAVTPIVEALTLSEDECKQIKWETIEEDRCTWDPEIAKGITRWFTIPNFVIMLIQAALIQRELTGELNNQTLEMYGKLVIAWANGMEFPQKEA